MIAKLIIFLGLLLVCHMGLSCQGDSLTQPLDDAGISDTENMDGGEDLTEIDIGQMDLDQPDTGFTDGTNDSGLDPDSGDSADAGLLSIQINSPVNGTQFYNTTLVVKGETSPNVYVAEVQVSVDDETFQPATGLSLWSFELDTRPMTAGLHKITARVTGADNTFALNEVWITISDAPIIPGLKRVNWSQAGFNGDIPDPPHVANVKLNGAVGDGVTNDYPAIIQAINHLEGNPGVIYFPPGNYLVTSPISLSQNGVIFRGDNSATSKLLFNLSGAGSSCITISRGQSNSFVSITDGYTKDSDTIIVTDASQFNVGDYAEIQQDNGDWDTVPASWATHAVGQIIQIVDINSNSLMISEPLRLDFDPSQGLEIRKIKPVVNVGIEKLTLERLDNSTVSGGYNIGFTYAAQCWVKGVESSKSVGSHIMISLSTHVEVTGCYIHDAFVYDGSSTRGYGVTLSNHASDNLIANNIFKHLRHSMSIKVGSNGNVAAYNYSLDPYRSELPHNFGADISVHGHYSFSNLFEGNIIQFIQIDQAWGPSGPYNTFFRNRTELYGIMFSSGSVDSDNQNLVGNEITSFGVFWPSGGGHFEYGNNISGDVSPDDIDFLNDKSYYLSAQPAFWNITCAWPSIGIPNEINACDNPAKERYDSGGPYTIYP